MRWGGGWGLHCSQLQTRMFSKTRVICIVKGRVTQISVQRYNGLCKVNDTSKTLTSPLQKTSPGKPSLGHLVDSADKQTGLTHKVTSHRYLSGLTPLARSRAVIHWPFSSCVQWKNMLLVTPAEHTAELNTLAVEWRSKTTGGRWANHDLPSAMISLNLSIFHH